MIYCLRATFVALVLFSASVALSQPCIDGLSGGNLCQQIDQYAFMSAESIGGGVINDNWGWVSPETGREYALQGRSSGTAFIDISDPANPVFIGNLPTHDIDILWRDIKVYNNYAFIVAESPNHGMQVFDLSELDAVVDPPVTFTETAHYEGFGNAHNIAINEASGHAYCVGTGTFAGGLHIVDIQNPLEPELAGGFEADGYTHDVQVVIYEGVDSDYTGRELAFASNENSVTIVDVTDKSDPVLVSRTEYETSAYAHQGWLTEDHSYFLHNDELDEGTFGTNTRTFVWDLTDLDAPNLIGFHESESPVIDHNLYVKGNYCYQANYTGGLRVLQLNNLATLDIEEIAYYDVIPDNDNVQFIGAWNVYPFFPSGTIILSNMYVGFHVLQPTFDMVTGTNTLDEGGLVLYPNPSSGLIQIDGIVTADLTMEVYASTGAFVRTIDLSNTRGMRTFDFSDLPAGLYLAKIGKRSARFVVQR